MLICGLREEDVMKGGGYGSGLFGSLALLFEIIVRGLICEY